MFFITGLIISILGALIVIKSEWMLRNFGRMTIFDRFLNTEGGSRLGWKLLGLIIFFIGVLIMTNLINDFLGWILSPLIRAMKAGQ